MNKDVGTPASAPDDIRHRRAIRKRSVTIAGHRTSVSLEQAFWEALRGIAEAQNRSVAAIIAAVDRANADAANGSSANDDGARASNLSSALRVYVLDELRRRATASA